MSLFGTVSSGKIRQQPVTVWMFDDALQRREQLAYAYRTSCPARRRCKMWKMNSSGLRFA